MIKIPGYYDLPMAEYLADPCPEPSLSKGIVKTLYERTPLHAHHEHPRLGGRVSDSSSRGDIGSAVHSLALGGGDVVYCDAVHDKTGEVVADWRTKAAQTFQDEARELGKIPLLERQRENVEAATKSLKARLGEYGAGQCERTMVWQSFGVWMRGRADFLDDAGDVDLDPKTTENADPVAWIKQSVISGGYDIQAAMRRLGHIELGKKPRRMFWIPTEIVPPYACSAIEVGEDLIEQAIRKIKHAAKLWRKCLDTNEWPGYTGSVTAAAPSWAAWELESRGIE